MPPILSIILIVLGALLLLFLLFIFALFWYTFGRRENPNYVDWPPEKWPKTSDWFVHRDRLLDWVGYARALPQEKLEMKTFDGLKLRAIYYPVEGSKTCVMMFHGYHGRAESDFAPMYRFYHELGFNILAVDQRAQNTSRGVLITYGIKESKDLNCWCSFINERYPGQKLILAGVSMGSGTVLMAPRLDLPDNVSAIVADCGFDSAWRIIKHVMNHVIPWLPDRTMNHVDRYCKVLGGFSMKDVDVEEVLAKTGIPVLFIHGDADTFVPTEMSVHAYEACASKKRLYLVPGAPHACASYNDTEGVYNVVKEFLTELAIL